MSDLSFRFDLYCTRLKKAGLKSLLDGGVRTTQIIGEAITERTPTSILRAAMSVASFLTGSELYTGTVFSPDEWFAPFPEHLYTQISELLARYITTSCALNDDNSYVHAIIKPGVRVAWATYDGMVEHVVVGADVEDASTTFVRDLIWKEVDPNHIVLSAPKALSNKNKDSDLEFATDSLIEGKPSEFTQDYSRYLQSALKQGVSRTVLFYGPPGTGKSTIARMLCDLLELRSLRIRVEEIALLSNGQLVDLVEFFGPDVVILDDLDRAHAQDALLETLQSLHKSVRFVFATANDIGRMDRALLRPERVDELIPVRRIDSEVVLKALGEFKDAYEDVSDWPIAFINEYVIRRRLLGSKEKAYDALTELQRRVDKLELGEDDE